MVMSYRNWLRELFGKRGVLAVGIMCLIISVASERAEADSPLGSVRDRITRSALQRQSQAQRRAARPARIASSDTVVVLGTQTCIRTPGGEATTCSQSFSASPAAGRKFVLLLDNGNPDGTQRSNGVSVKIGSREWIGAKEVTLSTATLSRTVDLATSNTIEVAVRGSVDSRASDSVVSVPDPTFRMAGIQTFTRGTGAPQIEKRLIAPPVGSSAPFTLVINNGAANGSQRVSSATISLGGVPLVTAGDLNPGVAVLERGIGPQSSDSLEVRLAGDPGSFLTVELRALDVAAPLISVTTPTEAMETANSNVSVAGTIIDSTAVALDLNGTPVSVGIGGAFTATAAVAMGSNTLTFTAVDAAGNQGVLTRHVIREPTPLGPPAVQGTSATTITPFRDAYAFLFRPPGGTQFGADSSFFEARRAAVLRGYLMHTEGTPIFNVKVEILDQPGAGW